MAGGSKGARTRVARAWRWGVEVSKRERNVLVAGAGIVGLWQALALARAGHHVTLCDASAAPHADSAASRYAGAMLAPWCEAEAAPAIVRDLGIAALEDWRAAVPGMSWNGSLVVAPARDLPELKRFGRATSGFEDIDGGKLAALEPALDGRFSRALFFPHEGHMAADHTLALLLDKVWGLGATVRFGEQLSDVDGPQFDTLIDARGLAAQADLPGLRGVRGERILVRSRDISLARPLRLLHPRHPIYVVPWPDGVFVIGATVIENEEPGPASARSVLELLGAAYALHPAFADAEIIDVGAGVRPAFADNVPRAIPAADGRTIHVNGAYRHGFLLAPQLAQAVCGVLAGDEPDHPLVVRCDVHGGPGAAPVGGLRS